MSATRWSAALSGVLMGLGVAHAQIPESSVPQKPNTIILKEEGKPDRECTIVKEYKEGGKIVREIRDPLSGKTFTVRDDGPPPSGSEPIPSGDSNKPAADKPKGWLSRWWNRKPAASSAPQTPVDQAKAAQSQAVAEPLPLKPVPAPTPGQASVTSEPMPHPWHNSPSLPTPATSNGPKLAPIASPPATTPAKDERKPLFTMPWNRTKPTASKSETPPSSGPILPAPQASDLPPAYPLRASELVPPTTPDGRRINQLQRTLHNAPLPSEREAAALELSSLPQRTNSQLVVSLLNAAQLDPAPSVRACCVRCLASMSVTDPAYRMVLAELQKDTDPRVRDEAQRALSSLGK